MTVRSETLWKRLQKALEMKSLLPRGVERMTPAEIARATQVREVNQFIQDYYYPAYYGQTHAPLSDEEAESLVATFEKASPPPPIDDIPVPGSTPGPPPDPNCQVCGKVIDGRKK